MKGYIRNISKKAIAILILVAFFAIEFVPVSKVFADTKPSYLENTYLFSSNKKVLESILTQIYDDYQNYYDSKWFNRPTNMYTADYICNKDRVIDIESQYPGTGLAYNDNRHYAGYAIRIPTEYLEYSNKKGSLTYFDFSNCNLRDIYELPNFSEWENVHVLFFADCNINSWSGFENAFASGKFDYIEKIYLNGNTITSSERNQLGIFNQSNIIATEPTVVNDKQTSPTVTPGIATDAINNGINAGITAIIAAVELKNTNFDSIIKAIKNGADTASCINKVVKEYYNGKIEKLKEDIKKSDYSDEVKDIVINEVNNVDTETSNTNTNSTPSTNTTTTTTTTTTTYYWWSSSCDPWVEISQENEWTKEKTLTIHPGMSGWLDYYTPVEDKDCEIWVNNKKITNNNGIGKLTVDKNGTYEIYVLYKTYGEGRTIYATVDKIDREAPSIEQTTQTYDKENHSVTLNITAKDNKELKAVYVNNKKIADVGGKKRTTVNYTVSETGWYKIKVEDQAGNVYEKTEYIKTDKEAPEIVNCTVVKKTGYKPDVTDTKYCSAKLGDTVTVTLKANEEIKSYGSNVYTSGANNYMAVLLNDILYKSGKIDVGSNTITFDIEITEELMEEFKSREAFNGWVNIEVLGISDKYGNQMDYTIENLLYIDNTVPVINRVNIFGESNSDGTIFIEPGKTISIEIYMNEKLGKNPTACYTEAKYYGQIILNKEKCYVYKVENLSCDSLIKAGIKENAELPVIIKNCIDLAGNTAEEYTINKENRSTNYKYLYYGVLEVGELYFATTKGSADPDPIEDINKDGYITNYDYLLMQQYVSKHQVDSLEYPDINNDGRVNSIDVMEVSRTLNQTQNKIIINEPRVLKVYNASNEQITGDNLAWKVLDKDGNIITSEIIGNSEDDNITFNEDSTVAFSKDGTVTLLVGDSIDISGITVQASWQESNSSELYVGEISLGIEKKSADDYYSPSIEVVTENKNKFDILGDVNNDGYITDLDVNLVQLYDIKIDLITDGLSEEDTNRALTRADVNKDGKVSLRDASKIKCSNYESYNIIKKGDSIDLNLVVYDKSTHKLLRYNDYKDESIENQISWEIIGGNDEFKIKTNEDGSATVTANGNAGTRTVVKATAKISEEYTVTDYFYVEIAENVEIELNQDKIEINLDEEQTEDIIINLNVNINNKLVEYKSNDENVAKVEVDNWGNAKVIPVNTGTTTIDVTCDGVTKSCEVNVIKPIQEIKVDKQSITLKESIEEIVNIELNADATEAVSLNSNDESVARIYYDEESKNYKVQAINEGSTTIDIFSPSNSEIKQTIQVTVEKLKTPQISKIQIEDNETETIYNVGEEIYIKIKFDDVIIGEAPDLLLKFGENRSQNEAEFIEFADDNTSLRYKYTVGEGDNGKLTIEKLVGEGLKDDTSKLNAVQIMDNDYYNRTYEDIEVANADSEVTSRASYGIVRLASTEETLETDTGEAQEESEEDFFINDGIYQLISDVETDTTKPTVSIETSIETGGNWLKIGDEIRVTVLASEELESAPKVYFNEIEANVEGKKEVFTATLKVTEELAEGYLEIKVNDYKDLSGNSGDELIAKEENINEPIIIDNSSSTIKKITAVVEEGKEYKAGDSFDIVVQFGDAKRSGIEYIKAQEAPTLNLKFGDNAAQGTITNDYEAGEYVYEIKYTYTISENDNGNLSVESILGTIEDAAGNTTELKDTINLTLDEIVTTNGTVTKDPEEENDQYTDNTQDTDEENKQDSNKDIVDNIYNGLIPQTGEEIIRNICIVLVIGIAVTLAIYCYKKNKKQNN